MSEAAKWYVVHTYSGYENKVAQNIMKVVENRKLQELIQDVRVPTESVQEAVVKKNDEDDASGKSTKRRKKAAPAPEEAAKDSAEGEKKDGDKKEDSEWKTIERKKFPGYVFVKMVHTDETWYIVRNTRGCTGFVGPESAPTALTDEEIQKTFGIDVSTIRVNFKEGDRVQISGTAMDGFTGIVQSINLDDRTVDLLVSMFGRETPTTLPITQVMLAED